MKKNKSVSINIRLSEEEHHAIKEAAEILHYASFSEFIRRTTLQEAERVISPTEPYNIIKPDNSIE